jgi:hypothetical protein
MTARDREPESPGPLKWAPKWTRMAAPAARRQTTAGERAAAGAQAGTATSRTGPAMETDQAERSFEGNAANKELRERMALAPNLPSDAR